MNTSPLVAVAIWNSLEHDWKINALRGSYADPSHEGHNLHALASQMVAMFGDAPEFWQDLGITPPSDSIN